MSTANTRAPGATPKGGPRAANGGSAAAGAKPGAPTTQSESVLTFQTKLPDAAISVSHLVKAYGEHIAVNDLSFEVAPGEIFALLGPNGAGKTTTVETLEGYRKPDGGEVRVLGLDPQRDAALLKPQIGVMLQQDGLYPTLRAREVLDLFTSYFNEPENPDELMTLVGLNDVAKTRCRQLSGGQKRRLALAVALVGKPRLIFMDEPTTGMDPQARRATWDIIHNLKVHGVTILLTTHFMDEAERLADRIAIIDNGRLVALDTPAGLTTSQSTTTTDVRVRTKAAVDALALGRLKSARAARDEGNGAYVVETGDAPTLLVELATWARDAHIDLTEIRIGRATLEDVFLRLTGKEMRE
ncbi:MAG TPA: ABC transporter ATP-binding protein [Ktedonobacterales bacterium]|nr:ABC transporter ATP-binding protein [Ktedonobacterales bacterium]